MSVRGKKKQQNEYMFAQHGSKRKIRIADRLPFFQMLVVPF
jgi:hypothetical protein